MKPILGVVMFLMGIAPAFAGERPNVILMMTDDQGYGDIAAHGNPHILTPNLDALHGESIRLTDFHVDPTCAPTRGAVMSGKYSHRARVWHTVRGGNHLREGEITMADVFKHNGYQTGMFGKWHLGANYPYRPMDRGFEEWIGSGDGGPSTSDDHFWNDRVNDMLWHNGEREYFEGYNPDVFYNEAMKYIKHRNTEKPFFVYLPTYIPHKPYTYPDKDMHKKYLDMGLGRDLAAFYACIERVDWSVGRMTQFLEEEGLAENTIVIFMTDNGSTHGGHGDIFNAGMSGHKGSTNEGGHRVPCFIRWPNGKLAGPRDITALAAHIDLLPTLTELCGMELPKPIDFDGKSLVSLLRDEDEEWPSRTLVVEKQRSLEYNRSNNAIMRDKWRLVGHKKLYDISKDPAQKNNIATEHPEMVESLLKDFDAYWERVIVEDRTFPMPIAGTDFDKEILLSTSELREGEGYAHGSIAEGKVAKGGWHFETASAGTYEIEVRRWPKEASAPFRGLPEVTKIPDAYTVRGMVEGVMTKGKLTHLPIASLSLELGAFKETREISDSDEFMLFDVELPKGRHEIESSFFNEAGEWMTTAYYVYIRIK